MIPTFPQMQPQSQTINSTSNETTLDSPNQEHMTTESDRFKPHSIPTMESAEPTPQELATSTSTLRTEPLLLQLATPKTVPTTLQDHAQHRLIPRPPEYELWSNNKKYNWRRKFEHK
jgi:hypothetical protein